MKPNFLKGFFLGEFFVKLLQFTFEFLVVRFISLSSLPAWVLYSFILRLAPYCSFGSISFINKFYPIVSSGDQAESSKDIILDTCSNIVSFAIIFFLSSLVSLVIYSYNNEQDYLWISLGLISISLILYFSYLQSVLRNTLNFKEYIQGFIIFSLAQLLLLVFFLDNLNIYHVVISIISSYLISNIFYIYRLKILGYRSLNFGFSKKVITQGFAPFFLSLSIFFMQSSDRVAMLIVGNDNFLIAYAVCFIFFQLGVVIVNTAGKLFSPYFLAENDLIESKRYISIYTRSFALLGLVIFFIYQIFSNSLISFLGPEKGVYEMEIGLYILIGFISSYSQIFFTKMIKSSREKIAISLTLCFSIVNILFIYLVAKSFESFYIVCLVSLFMNYLFCISTIFFSIEERKGAMASNLEYLIYPSIFLVIGLVPALLTS